ncbi:hypothetical protein D3C85_1274820 [compost metagenome]
MIGAGVFTQDAGEFERFFDQRPFGWPTGAVMGDPFVHFAVQGLAGGDVRHRQLTVSRQFFGQTTFAGAGAAEDQLQHGLFLNIFGEAPGLPQRSGLT